MKIGILTSSRADFGIYTPLLKELFSDPFFKTEIIAFGTHLSQKFGYTVNEIKKAGFPVKFTFETAPKNDTPQDITQSIAETISIFSNFWNKHKYDLVFALGDRYEMFAAVSAGTPFNVRFAHLHAGETTLGSIDNTYRHSISLMSEILFVSTEAYKKRATEIKGNYKQIFNVGALSIDNLKKIRFLTIKEFQKKFGINLSKPSVLSTFHPETVHFKKNKEFIKTYLSALNELKKNYQLIITMPNADTSGLIVRKAIEDFSKKNKEVITVESFGMEGYLSCMKHCDFMIGNSSSGFVEATFFPKWVINVGHRQDGRIISSNIIQTEIDKTQILQAVNKVIKSPVPPKVNLYGNGHTAKKIIAILKKIT